MSGGPWGDWPRYRPHLLLYLSSFSGLGRDGIDEALQRTLISLWRRCPDALVDSKAWLFRVARNAAIDVLREASRSRKALGSGRRLPEDAGDGIDVLPSPYPQPEAQALGAEEEAFVERFLSTLADGDRELLHLAFAEGMPYPAIAEVVGRPLGTVKWRIATLKKRLAARWEREFG